MSAWRDAKRAFDETDAALTDALARGEKAEAARLSKVLAVRARAFQSVELPDDPAENADILMRSIETYRNGGPYGVTMTERERAAMIAELERLLARIKKPSA